MNEFADLFWQAYLVNFLFWSALAQGGIAFAATLDITRARWGRRYTQLAGYCVGFLPVCVVLFAFLLLGRARIFPWVLEPIPEKAAYLNVPFLAGRGLIGLAALSFLSWKFLKKARRTPLGGGGSPWAVALVIVFMAVYSYLAFDLVMSLEPRWHSTLLGGYYAFSSYYLGISALCLAGYLRAGVPKDDRRKISTLIFGFALFWISLLWSQYIVIWYGDVPAETSFVYLRFYLKPWSIVTIAALVLAFALPFGILMPRRAKLTGIAPLAASACVVTGLLLERYVLVVPSKSPDELAFGWIYLLVTAAFAALFALAYRFTARRMKPFENS